MCCSAQVFSNENGQTVQDNNRRIAPTQGIYYPVSLCDYIIHDVECYFVRSIFSICRLMIFEQLLDDYVQNSNHDICFYEKKSGHYDY